MVLDYELPTDYKLLVKKGDLIDFQTSLFELKTYSVNEVNISTKLDVSPEKIFRYLKKLVGEEVKKGEILASKKNLLSTRSVISEFTGTITEIDHNLGKIILKTEGGSRQRLYSYFKGTVEDFDNKTLKIQVKDLKEFPLKSATTDFGGESFYLKTKDANYLTNDFIDGKIIIADQISSYTQAKVEALSVSGLVMLHALSDQSDIPFAQLKNIQDLEKIRKTDLPYCFVNAKNSTIYFYR